MKRRLLQKNAARPRTHGAVKRVLARMHTDDRGAISVLVLLMMWCLVALLAMIWNTSEEATRKQRLQVAADSASHAAATAMARIVNATAAQNLVICQDASTETIWRAVTPTHDAIQARLREELRRLANEARDSDAMRREIAARLESSDRAYASLQPELIALQSDTGSGITDPKELLLHRNEKRRAASVIAWVHDTYVDGLAATSGSGPPRPGAPIYDGQSGLRNIVGHLKDKAPNAAIVRVIEEFIQDVEAQLLAEFEMRTQKAVAEPVPAVMAEHRSFIYQQELAMVSRFTHEVESQRQDLQAYYKADLTYASVGNPAAAGPAQIEPPVHAASDLPTWHREDYIRHKYPNDTWDVFGSGPDGAPYWSPDIDPINVHVGLERLWHPTMAVTIYPRLPGIFVGPYPASPPPRWLVCEPPGGWGHSWATPIERYFFERVDADQQTLNSEHMVKLDDARAITLAGTIRSLLGIPGEGTVAEMPLTLPDDQPDPAIPAGDPPVYRELPVPYMLRSPPKALSVYRDHIDRYNQLARNYCSEVRALWAALSNYRDAFGYYTERFASDTWYGRVSSARNEVLTLVGAGKEFTVLKTYDLRQLPDWAHDGMFWSVYTAAFEEIVRMNERGVADYLVGLLVAKDPYNWGLTFLDPAAKDRYLRAKYYPFAIAAAREALGAVVPPFAKDIAFEWTERPWPYEITPPLNPEPPFKGLSKPDRTKYFTVVAAARENAQVPRRLLMDWVFKPDNSKMVANAQADAFNWMEFNSGYGAAARYDQIVHVPWAGYQSPYTHFVGAPRSWRDGTVAGWNWHARLSVGDAIFDAAQTNAELRTYLNDAGLATFDGGSFHELQLH